MRLMHISDLHLGKRLCETDLSDEIEHALFSEILGRIFEEVSEEKPIDALLITGDVFDKSLPSADAEKTFGKLLAKAIKLGMKVFCISGNHDSARRLAAFEKMLSEVGVYISREFSADEPVRVEQLGNFDIALMPFIATADVCAAYPDEDIPDITAAVKTVFRHAGIPSERPCILLAHETFGNRVVGGEDGINAEVLDGFAYTALGHYHMSKNITERARYCGTPVCYSKDEIISSPQKSCDIIDIEPNGELAVTQKEIIPQHKFRIIKDSFANLMSDKYPETEDYCYITVSDFEGVSGIQSYVRKKFVNMISLNYSNNDKTENNDDVVDDDDFSFNDEFGMFYKKVTGNRIDEKLLKTAEEIFEQTEKATSDGTQIELINSNDWIDDDELISGGNGDDN